MARKKQPVKGDKTLTVQGMDLSFVLTKFIPTVSLIPMLHFDQRGDGSMEVRYNPELLPEPEQLTAIDLIRKPESVYHHAFNLVGTEQRFTISRVRRLPLDHFYLHFNRLQDGTWRIAYGSEVIPNIQDIHGLRIGVAA